MKLGRKRGKNSEKKEAYVDFGNHALQTEIATMHLGQHGLLLLSENPPPVWLATLPT
jgi:hypothetical protein